MSKNLNTIDISNPVKVWDPLVRLFHWVLVSAFFIAFITEEDFLNIHTISGYIILALICFRLVWGLFGTRYARFANFIYSPGKVKQFIKDTFSLKAKRYIGHNPAGGVMIILLIVSLLMCTISGIAVYGVEEQAGPMALWFVNSYSLWGKLLEEIHEFFANFIVFLIFVHLLGVIVESVIHKENLVKSMITGWKSGNKI